MNLLGAFAGHFIGLLYVFCVLDGLIDCCLTCGLDDCRDVVLPKSYALEFALVAAITEIPTVEGLNDAHAFQPSVFIVLKSHLLVLLIEQNFLSASAVTSDGSDCA